MNFCSNLQLNLRFKSKKVWSGQPGEGSTYIQRRQLGAADVASVTASTLTALVSLPASELKPWHSVPQLPPGLEMPFCASGPSCVPSLFARRGEQLCFITFFRVGNLRWVHFTARAWLCRAWYRHDLRLLSNGVKSLSLKDWMPPERGCTEPSMLFTRGREDWNQRWCSLDLPEALPSPKCCVCNWDCSPLVTYSAAASSCLGSAVVWCCCCSCRRGIFGHWALGCSRWAVLPGIVLSVDQEEPRKASEGSFTAGSSQSYAGGCKNWLIPLFPWLLNSNS